jgi:Domain of unknown function (DUF151)
MVGYQGGHGPGVMTIPARLRQRDILTAQLASLRRKLILDQNTKVSARVSDAIALALHLGVAIDTEDRVLDTAAVTHTAIRSEGDERTPDEVEEFRRFLDSASPADFDPDWSLRSWSSAIHHSRIANHARMRS